MKLSTTKIVIMPEKGVIRIKISPLQGKKGAKKIIYVDVYILLLMCSKKQKYKITNNITLQRPVFP